MQFNVPPDLEALVQRHLATGAFANAEDAIRRALETLEAEESWTVSECQALDEKIGRALVQSAAGRTFAPDDARRKLAALREEHLANSGRLLDPFLGVLHGKRNVSGILKQRL